MLSLFKSIAAQGFEIEEASVITPVWVSEVSPSGVPPGVPGELPS